MKLLVLFSLISLLCNQALAQEDVGDEPTVEQQEESYQGQEDLESEKNYVTEEEVVEEPAQEIID
jgi:hypothetical protein